ncbi:MAG TPA: beta-propeller fold lactonase family protein [Acidobacteriaceae bacterium]|jgi:6-phosphogluconolactonase (cycloisomerase 2 family)|nr:beta-propeller fold lactonase family protein [Acidobacteriaceae bacterium]
MKWKTIGQVSLAVTACLGLGLGVTSCSPSQTIDYVFVTSNGAGSTNGEVSSYHVDSESGALSLVAGSPFPDSGSNPVALVASPNQQYLYVANHDSSNIVVYTIGTDGQLALGKSYTTPGKEPVSVAMNATGTLLFVLDYYAPGFSDATPGPGALVVYPVNADGTLANPVLSAGLNYSAVQCFPGGVAVAPDGSYAYVSNTNAVIVTTSPPTNGTAPVRPATCPAQGTISAFSVNSAGSLAKVPGSPFAAGTTPTGIAVDQTSRFVYTTDSVQNQLIVYDILKDGSLSPLIDGPFSTGTFPVSVTVDPRDEYLYVSNYNASSLNEYTISQATGQPTGLSSSTFATDGAGPTCVVVDPAFGRFVYTTDATGDYIQGGMLNPNTGILANIQNSPYNAVGHPTCVTAVPHGNHAIQTVPVTAGG